MPSCCGVDEGVGFHEGVVEVTAKIHSVRCANILHNAIENEECRKFPRRRSRLDMGFEHSGDRLRVFCVLFRDDSQVADLVSVVALEIFQRFFKVGGHFSRRAAGDRTSRGPGRHGDFTQKKRGTQRCRSMLTADKIFA